MASRRAERRSTARQAAQYRDRACKGKHRHDTHALAIAHIISHKRNGHDPDAWRMVAYHCKHCHGWHVGHSYRAFERIA